MPPYYVYIHEDDIPHEVPLRSFLNSNARVQAFIKELRVCPCYVYIHEDEIAHVVDLDVASNT